MLRSIANVMKNSGCDVPEWILHLDRAPKATRKRLAKKPIERPHIETVTTYDLKQSRKAKKEKVKTIKKYNKQKGHNDQKA